MFTYNNVKLYLIIILSIFSLNIYSQTDCETVPFTGESASLSTFLGGVYKPHRTDIGGSPSSQQLDYFPILVLFIQYQGETGGNFPGNPDSVNAWPAGSPPNYLSRTITNIRADNSSNWWDSYNGYEINDYWHEFSRGKLHIQGESFSIILPHTKSWYDSNGGQAKMNKDVFDYLKNSNLGIDWKFYDKWTNSGDGNFSWEPDELIDMIYMIFRSKTNGYLGGAAGEASIGSIEGSTSNQYTVYDSAGVVVKVQGGSFNRNCSGHRTDARADLIYSRHAYFGVSTHEHGHY